MLLVIDNGNTNGVFAIYDGERQFGEWRCSSDPRRTSDEYAVWLTQLMRLVNLGPDDITVSEQGVRIRNSPETTASISLVVPDAVRRVVAANQ